MKQWSLIGLNGSDFVTLLSWVKTPYILCYLVVYVFTRSDIVRVSSKILLPSIFDQDNRKNKVRVETTIDQGTWNPPVKSRHSELREETHSPNVI